MPDHWHVASDVGTGQDTRQVHLCTLGSSMAQASFSTSGLTFSLLLTALASANIACYKHATLDQAFATLIQ